MKDKISQREKDAIEVLGKRVVLLKNGYTNTGLPWYSPEDLSRLIGKSRQYWCKLIKKGKLKAHVTSAGPIVTSEQLVEYYGLI